MPSFQLNDHLNQIYKTFPEANHQPIIGITANYADGDACLRDKYYQQVVDAGGTPVIIPPIAEKEAIVNTLDHLDGLLLTGGGDINPLWTGEEPSPQLHGINATRDLPELLITRLAYNRQIPNAAMNICTYTYLQTRKTRRKRRKALPRRSSSIVKTATATSSPTP